MRILIVRPGAFINHGPTVNHKLCFVVRKIIRPEPGFDLLADRSIEAPRRDGLTVAADLYNRRTLRNPIHGICEP